ncbi:hypothetical protein L1987_20899 [Smallanthus sonchifolius]|uniref:Uncharacterized protein n=1 Tax=Smallanthus sonchifolius TaxID=185202 RepID=A0ACB9IUK5_9ASTR|nr:hypothetical protein L1987_20899 [Smallanthus sonchifolius]
MEAKIMGALVNLNNARLAVNLARFNKEGKVNREDNGKATYHHKFKHNGQGYENGGSGGYYGERTYLDALLRNPCRPPRTEVMNLLEEMGGSLVQWYDQSLMGKTHDLNILKNLLESRDRNPVDMSTAKGNLSNSCDDSVEDTPLHGTQKLKNMVGPQSRKQPRIESMDDDPFNLEQLIGEVNPVPVVQRNFRVEADGGGASDPPIPDLNASMGAGVSEIQLNDSPNSVNMECGETTSEVNGVVHIEQEVQDTIRLGKELGIELENDADQVKAAIIGEMEDAIAQ